MDTYKETRSKATQSTGSTLVHLPCPGDIPPPKNVLFPQVPSVNCDPGISTTGGRLDVRCCPQLSQLDPLPRNIHVELDASFCLGYLLECRTCQLVGSVVIMVNHMHSEAMKTSLRKNEGRTFSERSRTERHFWVPNELPVPGPSPLWSPMLTYKRENKSSEMEGTLTKSVSL